MRLTPSSFKQASNNKKKTPHASHTAGTTYAEIASYAHPWKVDVVPKPILKSTVSRAKASVKKWTTTLASSEEREAHPKAAG